MYPFSSQLSSRPGCHKTLSSVPCAIQWVLVNCCSSVAQSCLTLCDSMNCSMPDFPVLNHLLEFAKTHVHCVDDAIQQVHPLLSASLALSLPQHQGLFQRVGFLLWVAKILEFQLQHQSFQRVFRTDFL